ncbi:hypothetical protein CRENBAI_006464 [Crenichthys baileyi]|uniref:Uncharacterized protein n=1 Tax=Crenichthys baileyi TaxID=28760 RepID=A0AAV9SEX3_9TELE
MELAWNTEARSQVGDIRLRRGVRPDPTEEVRMPLSDTFRTGKKARPTWKSSAVGSMKQGRSRQETQTGSTEAGNIKAVGGERRYTATDQIQVVEQLVLNPRRSAASPPAAVEEARSPRPPCNLLLLDPPGQL